MIHKMANWGWFHQNDLTQPLILRSPMMACILKVISAANSETLQGLMPILDLYFQTYQDICVLKFLKMLKSAGLIKSFFSKLIQENDATNFSN